MGDICALVVCCWRQPSLSRLMVASDAVMSLAGDWAAPHMEAFELADKMCTGSVTLLLAFQM